MQNSASIDFLSLPANSMLQHSRSQRGLEESPTFKLRMEKNIVRKKALEDSAERRRREECTFKPKIQTKSKKIKRSRDTSDLLYSDAMRRHYKREFDEKKQDANSRSLERSIPESSNILWKKMKKELFSASHTAHLSKQGMDNEQLFRILSEMGYINAEEVQSKTLIHKIWQLISKDGVVLKTNLLIFLAAVTNTEIPEDEYQGMVSRHSQQLVIQEDVLALDPQDKLVADVRESKIKTAEVKLGKIPKNDKFLTWKEEFISLNEIQKYNLRRKFIILTMTKRGQAEERSKLKIRTMLLKQNMSNQAKP